MSGRCSEPDARASRSFRRQRASPLSTIKRRLCGKSPFTLEEIEQIAKHFNVAASKLLSSIFMSESREAALADGGEE